jgi:hypothetical protein
MRIQHHGTRAPYRSPVLERFGTFREITREGFVGNVDGGLILGPDGSTAPAADPRASGSR